MIRDEILEAWEHPHNFGTCKVHNFTQKNINRSCGDEMTVTGLVKSGVLEDIMFSGEQCAISRYCASGFSFWIKGLPVDKIKEITRERYENILAIQDLMAARSKCALLFYDTLQNALKPFTIQQ